MSKRIFITGGAGFIGSALIRNLIGTSDYEVMNYDKLTYAASLTSLTSVIGNPRYSFIKGDICDAALMKASIESFKPDVICHLAAESHVDRSIDGPSTFITTNVVGTSVLLEAARHYYSALTGEKRENFRFHHISTDEVFGTLGAEGLFHETTAYDPRSPYSASKAASDHLVSAWGHTYGLPVIISNCSNNYGNFQFPEKLIPLMIIKALSGQPLPVYGNGENIRDWLYVGDHARALRLVFEKGRVGESYNVGGNAERKNLDVVKLICSLLDKEHPRSDKKSYATQISFVKDRPGHDARYAIDATKIKNELGFEPSGTFENGLLQTIKWYLQHEQWWKPLLGDKYDGMRLGLKAPATPKEAVRTGAVSRTKGIILAGGSGTRLHPATLSINKQLLPIYDKPMIYYPLTVQMLAGIRDVLLISSPEFIDNYQKLLGDGSRWGMNIEYAIQPKPEGLAQAFIIGADFIGKDPASLILGDNIFFGAKLDTMMEKAANRKKGATVFAYRVDDPERYGVVSYNAQGKAETIVEKPTKPLSNWAVTGLYFYDNSVIDICANLKPSPRGELEITDVNRVYLERGDLHVETLGRGYAWLDTGTHDSLIEASEYVRTLQKRQRLLIGSPEEVAFEKGFITKQQLLSLAKPFEKTNYGQYLRLIAEEQ